MIDQHDDEFEGAIKSWLDCWKTHRIIFIERWKKRDEWLGMGQPAFGCERCSLGAPVLYRATFRYDQRLHRQLIIMPVSAHRDLFSKMPILWVFYDNGWLVHTFG